MKAQALPDAAPAFDLNKVRPRMGYFEGSSVYGWCIVVPGHGYTQEQLAAITNMVNHGHVPAATEERVFDFKPSVVHCSKYGAPCAYEGEQHGHWFPAAETAPGAAQYTVIRTN